jgi:hypothetical protein
MNLPHRTVLWNKHIANSERSGYNMLNLNFYTELDMIRFSDMTEEQKDLFVAEIIEFFEDDGRMNGRSTEELVAAFSDYHEKDLKQQRVCLVATRDLYQSQMGRGALYIAKKEGLDKARKLREKWEK